MTKKFAVLAAMAALLVACGGPSAEELEAKAKATADSIANVLRMDSLKAAEAAAAAAAAAAMDSAAVKLDSAAAKLEGAADAAKKAVGH